MPTHDEHQQEHAEEEISLRKRFDIFFNFFSPRLEVLEWETTKWGKIGAETKTDHKN